MQYYIFICYRFLHFSNNYYIRKICTGTWKCEIIILSYLNNNHLDIFGSTHLKSDKPKLTWPTFSNVPWGKKQLTNWLNLQICKNKGLQVIICLERFGRSGGGGGTTTQKLIHPITSTLWTYTLREWTLYLHI